MWFLGRTSCPSYGHRVRPYACLAKRKLDEGNGYSQVDVSLEYAKQGGNFVIEHCNCGWGTLACALVG